MLMLPMLLQPLRQKINQGPHPRRQVASVREDGVNTPPVVEIFFEQADKLSAVEGWLCNEVGRKCEADPRDGGSPDADRAVCLALALHGNGKCASVRVSGRAVTEVARVAVEVAGSVLRVA